MGISRLASEIQIYSAVYSPAVDRSARSPQRARLRASRELKRTRCIARGNHICSVTKLRIFHTGLTARARAVTYLTFRQVAARVELEFTR